MDKFATFYGLEGQDVLAFHFDGEKIAREETPNSLETEDGDLIEAKCECQQVQDGCRVCLERWKE